MPADATIEPFRLHVHDRDIADLKTRLRLTRFPDQAPEAPWAFGTDLAFMHRVVEHWRDRFDWRAEEARLNAFPQFMTEIDGIPVHFLHVAGKGPNPMPLLLSHGWPGSVFEFLDIIPRLTDPARFGGDPADAFTVVAPSLPGYGLSFRPGQKRYDLAMIVAVFAELMQRLGYPRYGAQGGDWGSFITSRLACDHPDRLAGIHLNLLPLRRDTAGIDARTEDETRYLTELAHFLKENTGYQWIQGTRPQTLAYGLTDSPAGLAAWILEKFRAWSDCKGDPTSILSLDRLLGNVSFYWFTGTIGSSFWPYYARMHGPWPIGARIDVPMGYAQFPTEILKPPRSMAERVYADIRRWSVMPEGGHFAAMEQPEALAHEIAEFFRGLR